MERLAPLRDEVERLRTHSSQLEDQIRKLDSDNDGLAQQLQAVVEKSDLKQAEMIRKASEYDTLMERLTELQQVRANLENELGPLREERAAILQENAHLREGAQPEKYARLKEDYSLLRQQCEQLQSALQEEKAEVQRQQDANVQLQQNLAQATNPQQLQTIRDRVERYRRERDQALKQVEEFQARLELLEIDSQQKISEELQRANEASQNVEHWRDQLAACEQEANAFAAQATEYEQKMLRYREERNQAKAHNKVLQQKIDTLQNTIETLVKQNDPQFTSMESSGLESFPYNSPLHTQYGRDPSMSPTYESEQRELYGERAEYSPQHYTADNEQYIEASSSPTGRPEKSREYHKGERRQPGSQPTSSSSLPSEGRKGKRSSSRSSTMGSSMDESKSFPVSVKTKEGVVEMYIERPLELLNAKRKPQVIVKRSDGDYEMATLMFAGKIDHKDMAGVQLDIRMQSKSH